MKRTPMNRGKGIQRKRYDWKRTDHPLGYSGRAGKPIQRTGKGIKAKPDPKLAKWSKEVRERDDYTCRKCGRRDPEIVIGHHIAPRGRRRDLKYVVANGATLCEIPCHQWVHANPLQATAIGLLSIETYEAARKELAAA